MLRTFFFLLLLLNCINSNAQSKWKLHSGLHLSTDAGVYMTGPSFQIGGAYYFTSRLSVNTYTHYFAVRRRTAFSFDNENAFFNTVTNAVLLQIDGGRNRKRGMFYALGIAYQYLVNDVEYQNSPGFKEVRNSILPAARIGYHFPVNKLQMGVETNLTGPFSERYPNGGSYSESLTQLSLGVRMIF